VISPMFEFSQAVRKVIYTTNTIESLNSGYRRLPNMCEQSFLTAAVQNMKRLARTFFIRLSPLYIALIQTATLRFPWKAAVC